MSAHSGGLWGGELDTIILAGVFDGASSLLAEETGFDGLWASSYSISAACGLPDAGCLSITALLSIWERIVSASSLAVIADCDNGFGDERAVAKLVQRAESIGVKGVCIEDNAYPKRSSLYGERHELTPAQEHASKVAAAKSARSSRELLVVARTEALVQQHGIEEALERASAYAEAGADAILIHSVKRDPAEVLAFAAAWNSPVPLMAVPTTYDSIRVDELFSAGFRVVVFANYAIRAAVAAMRSTMALLMRSRTGSDASTSIASVQDVNGLVRTSPRSDGGSPLVSFGGRERAHRLRAVG